MNNDAFQIILDQYSYLCDRWYKNISKRIRIDKDTFKSEFYYILFKAALRYKIEESGTYGKAFERYLNASLKKLITTFKRKTTTLKYKTQKRQVTFCPISHNLTDNRHIPLDKEIENSDMLEYCKNELKDKGLATLRYDGYSVDEACDKLKISQRQYKNIMERFHHHSEIKNAFEVN